MYIYYIPRFSYVCYRSCDYNHPCMKKCFEDCEKCNVPILKNLPCGHQIELECFVDINTFSCDIMVIIHYL